MRRALARTWRYWSHPVRSLALVSALVLVSVLGVVAVSRVPVPYVHDEQAYMLGAETFAAGRLTNPPHPMWRHFETFHVIFEPTYQSKYPPLQSLFLAAGLRLGHPIIGVWLSCVLMACAVTWMMRGFAPPRWALVGGVIVALQFTAGSYWAQSYWGGALAATGGAFVFGALQRMRRGRVAARHGALLGVGLMVLANTRPFEGALVGLVAFVMFAAWFVRRVRRRDHREAARVLAPLLIVVAIGAGLMGLFHGRVTGSPLKMPYMVHNDQYAAAPQFVFLPKPPKPDYNHAIFDRYIERYDYGEYDRKQSLEGFVALNAINAKRAWAFYLGWALTPPVLLGIGLVLARRYRAAVVTAILTLLIVLAGHSIVFAYQWHYTAPALPMLILLIVLGLRAVGGWRIGSRRAGRIVLVLFAVALLVQAASSIIGHRRFWAYDGYWFLNRQRLEDDLASRGGKHLAIVRYGPKHSFMCEYVYNHADIDGSPVVFARDMGTGENEPLLEYFADRTVWLVTVDHDGEPPRVEPYQIRDAGP